MKSRIATLGIFLSFLLLASGVYAQQFDLPVDGPESYGGEQERIGTAGFTFLKVGQSARAAGMGDAFTAVANDVSTVFRNPAGITHIQRAAWTGTYTQWIAGAQFFSGAAVWNTGSARGGVLGLSLVYFKPEDTEETSIFEPNGTGRNIGAMDMALSLTYALRLTDKFSFGTTLTWVHESILDYSLNTAKVDVGTLFYTGFRNSRIAMSLKNLGRDEQYNQVPFWMPLNFYMAIADEVYGRQGDPAYFTVAFESLYVIDFEQRYHLGAELWMGNMFAVRGGYKFNYDAEGYSLGAGLKYEVSHGRKLMIDISYTDFGELLQAPLRVSIGGEF